MRKFSVVIVAASLSVGLTFLLTTPPAFSEHATSSNLFARSSSSFDDGIGSWVSFSSGATLSTVATPVQSGTAALAVTTNGADPLDVWLGSGNGPATWTPAVAGARYTSTAFVRASSQGRTVAPFEVFYDSAGSKLAAVWGQPGADVSSSWTPTNAVVGIAPQGSAYVLFGLVIYKTALNEVHYIDTASITSTTVRPTTIHGPFHTSGNGIYGSDGARVTFRGIHRDGTESASPRFPSDDEIAQARAWGANVIRVPLNEALWMNTCPSQPRNDPSYPGLVDQEVSQITSRGTLAMLDLHFSVSAACTYSGMQTMPDAAYAQTFWSTLAKRYKDNPLVAFDLYNEPHDVSDTVWLNGGTATVGSTTFKAVGMQQLYKAVRAQGASNLVFISGNAWGNIPAATRVSGTNIVNAVHDYTCPQGPPPGCTAIRPYDPTPILNNWTAVGASSPVMVTESGFPNRNDGTFNGNLINAAESRGWGWDIFAWDGSTSGLFGIVAGIGTTYEPSAAGMPVLTGLANN
jgi:aryl-phospho-beta-D-glucosidase BglC (GH1 family)